MNVNGSSLGQVNIDIAEESSDDGNASQSSQPGKDITVDTSVSGSNNQSNVLPVGNGHKRRRGDSFDSTAPVLLGTSTISIDEARRIIKLAKKGKGKAPVQSTVAVDSVAPVLSTGKDGKLTKTVKYDPSDERHSLYEYGLNLHQHLYDLACYVLEAKWHPGCPKKGSTFASKTYDFPSNFFGIEEKATNVLKSLAVLLGSNSTPKQASPYSGLHYAHVLIGAAVKPDASLYYKDAVKAFGGDMMIRTLIKDIYTDEQVRAIADCTHAQKETCREDPDRLIEMIAQGYKPGSKVKYAGRRPDFYDSD